MYTHVLWKYTQIFIHFYSKEYRIFQAGYKTIYFLLFFLLIILYIVLSFILCSYFCFISSLALNNSAEKRKIPVLKHFDFTLIVAFTFGRLEVMLKYFSTTALFLFFPPN